MAEQYHPQQQPVGAQPTSAPPVGFAAPPPPPPPAPYGQHPQGAPIYYAPVAMVRNNGLAIASLVLGILWIYWIGSVLAVIFGHVALGQISRSNGSQQGRGMAIAGLVLGWIGVGILLLLLLVGASAGA
jgi:hypothetical protein